MEKNKKVEIVGNYGAMLSLIEVGLGSILHSLHIPFAGIFLSLNQGYLLCRAEVLSQEKTNWTSYNVSNVAAVLKSLSPAGQKLGPMLSLSMQGLLFNLGTRTFGINPVGLSLGMVLLSFWSFVQPLITYYLFFGEKLISAAQYAYEKTLPYHQLEPRHLVWIFSSLVIIKALVGIFLAFVAWKTEGASLYQEKLLGIALTKDQTKRTSKHSPFFLAIKDLFRPLFLISLTMTALFLSYSQHEKAQIGWYLLRPIAIGFIFFYFSRTLTLDRWIQKMEGGRFDVFAKGCKEALVRIRSII